MKLMHIQTSAVGIQDPGHYCTSLSSCQDWESTLRDCSNNPGQVSSRGPFEGGAKCRNWSCIPPRITKRHRLDRLSRGCVVLESLRVRGSALGNAGSGMWTKGCTEQ